MMRRGDQGMLLRLPAYMAIVRETITIAVLPARAGTDIRKSCWNAKKK
jgi:hypothetical protein